MNRLKDNLYKHVEFLTTIDPPRNYLNKSSIDKAVSYIAEQLKDYGYEVEMQNFTTSLTSYTHQNVIARYGNEGDPRLIVGAHYDVCGNTPGADDNASAVAGMLETARLLMKQKPALDYCVEFVAYANEEPPFFATTEMGSYVHAKMLNDYDTEVIGMICYEMIGYFSDEPGSQKLPEGLELLREGGSSGLKDLLSLPALEKYDDPFIASLVSDAKKQLSGLVESIDIPDRGNFIIVMANPDQDDFASKVFEGMKAGSDIEIIYVPLPKVSGLSELSDHRNYWDFGYNAVMINDTSHLRNPHYHELTDTIDTLNFDKMSEVVKGIFNSAKGF